MKRLILFTVAVAFAITQMSAQESTFVKGDKVLNLGIGFGSTYYGSYYTSHTPAISASFEVGVKDGVIDKGSIGVGGYVGFASANWENYYKTTNIMIGARGSFHYPLVNKLDTYTGLILGYNIFNYKYESSYAGETGSTGNVVLAWYAGAKYYFSDKFAAFGEIGYGISYLTLGVAFKF